MRLLIAISGIALLAACDPASNPRPEPEASSSGPGISISGYGRVGVSTGG